MAPMHAIMLSILLFISSSDMFSCNGGGTTFDVLNFGAIPGSKDDNRQAFVRAWLAACHSYNPATLFVPPGVVFILGETAFQGPCKNPVTFMVQGTLQALANVSAYSGDGWISFEDVVGLTLTGGGTFDGQGQAVWQYNDCKNNADCVHLPSSIHLFRVNKTRIKEINVINAMGFHFHVLQCSDIRLQRLSISSPGDSPNTDGIHISKSKMVKVSRSVIKTGDDCISIGQGSMNVNINQITCGPGHGISLGSLGKVPNESDVTGVIVNNCTLIGTQNGVRIKTYPESNPSLASTIVFQNIILDNVDNPIIIDQSYGSKSSKPSLVKLNNVIYQDIRGTTSANVAVSLMCSSKAPCENVYLHNINLQSTGKRQKWRAVCTNAKVGFSGVQNPAPC